MMELLNSLTGWTLRNSLDGALLFFIVFAILAMTKTRLAPQLRTGLLVLVGIRFFLPMAPESSWSLRGFLPTIAAVSQTSENPTVAERVFRDGDGVRNRIADSHAVGSAENVFAAPKQSGFGKWGVISLVWMGGFFAVLALAGFQWKGTERRVRGLREYRDEDGLELLKRVGFPRQVKIVEASSGEGVAVFGLFRVTHLILPKDFSQRFDRAGALGILRHEMEHIRSKDLYWNWVILFLQSWHWFNPAIWFAGRLYQNEREICCDRFALRNESEEARQTYGSTLIRALEAGRFHSATPSLISFVTRKNELKQRLELIMKNKPYQGFLQLSVIAVIAVFSLASFTSPLGFAADEDGGPKKEGPRGGDAKKEGPRDGDAKKAGPRDGDAKKDGPRDGDQPKKGPRDGDKPKAEGEGAKDRPAAGGAAMNTKEGKVFATYDKQDTADGFVTAEEMEKMREGKLNSSGRRQLRKEVKRSDKDGDGKLNFEEFKFWYTIGRRDEKAEFR